MQNSIWQYTEPKTSQFTLHGLNLMWVKKVCQQSSLTRKDFMIIITFLTKRDCIQNKIIV